jgi:hypothetical protein
MLIPRLQRANQKKTYTRWILEIQSLTAAGKHYTLEHFANSKIRSLLVGKVNVGTFGARLVYKSKCGYLWARLVYKSKCAHLWG